MVQSWKFHTIIVISNYFGFNIQNANLETFCKSANTKSCKALKLQLLQSLLGRKKVVFLPNTFLFQPNICTGSKMRSSSRFVFFKFRIRWSKEYKLPVKLFSPVLRLSRKSDGASRNPFSSSSSPSFFSSFFPFSSFLIPSPSES